MICRFLILLFCLPLAAQAQTIRYEPKVEQQIVKPAIPTSQTDVDLPKRVVSLNLCTDQLAMAYTEEGQLVGVSFNAANPAISAQADVAKSYPPLRGEAEEILEVKPDLVLMGAGQNPPLKSWLAKQDIEVMEIGVPSSIDEAQSQMKRVGNRLGNGAKALADTVIQNTAIQPGGTFWEKTKVAVFYPGGFSDGSQTLLHDVITRMKGVNVAAEKEGATHLSIEQVIAAKPDMIIMQQPSTAGVKSQSEALIEHPALKKSSALKITLPAPWLICPHRHLADISAAMQGTTLQ